MLAVSGATAVARNPTAAAVRQHQADGEHGDRPPDRAQFAPRHLLARGVQQRRKHEQADHLGGDPDLRHAGDEADQQAGDDEQRRSGHGEPSGEGGDHGRHDDQEQHRLDTAHATMAPSANVIASVTCAARGTSPQSAARSPADPLESRQVTCASSQSLAGASCGRSWCCGRRGEPGGRGAVRGHRPACSGMHTPYLCLRTPPPDNFLRKGPLLSIVAVARRVLPMGVERTVRDIRNTALAAVLRGGPLRVPSVLGAGSAGSCPFGSRPNAACPGCRSVERHRAAWLHSAAGDEPHVGPASGPARLPGAGAGAAATRATQPHLCHRRPVDWRHGHGAGPHRHPSGRCFRST